MIVLWLLLFRALGIELRHQLHHRLWEQFWDVVFFGSSLLLAIFFGAALGNVVRGVDMNAEGHFFAPLWTDFAVGPHPGILDWYTVLTALTAVGALAQHGALWLILRIDGKVRHRSQTTLVRLWPIVLLLTALTTAATYVVQSQMRHNLGAYPLGWIAPTLSIGGLVGVRWWASRGRWPLALGAHLGVIIIRQLTRRVLASRLGSEAKAQTVTGFAQSIPVFVLYFGAFGFGLDELGVPLTTYLAGASVIGLAVSFGSPGVVQDVITGLTVVFSDLLDVGDMANVGGQVGIVESIGMRFTTLIGFSGERVFVPNRTIANVINYPHGYIRAYVDARVQTSDKDTRAKAMGLLGRAARAAYEQYPGVLLVAPTVENFRETSAGYGYVRIKFRVWPGQSQLIEGPIKEGIANALKQLDASYAPWMVSVYYRAESNESKLRKRLPRPAVLRAESRKAAPENTGSKHGTKRGDAVVPESP